MQRKKIDFTLDETLDELLDILNFLNSELLQSTGVNFHRVTLGLPLFSYNENDSNGHTFTKTDIATFPIHHYVSCAYEYAKGFHYEGVFPDDILCAMEEFRNSAATIIDQINRMKKGIGSIYDFLYELCFARYELDNNDSLTLKRLALLTGVDERTIRNAASAKDETNRLKTIKFGSSTLVENEEAKKWLSKRPDFQPTQFIRNPARETPRYFENPEGFGKYITFCMNEQGLTAEFVAKILEVDTRVISDLEAGVDNLSIDQARKLADVLQENRSQFIKDYMRIFHLEALADLFEINYPSGEDEIAKLNRMTMLVPFKHSLGLQAEMNVLKNYV